MIEEKVYESDIAFDKIIQVSVLPMLYFDSINFGFGLHHIALNVQVSISTNEIFMITSADSMRFILVGVCVSTSGDISIEL